MKLPRVRRRWLLLLLWLGLLNLAICVVFPNCGILDRMDVAVEDVPVLKHIPSHPLQPAIQAYGRRRFLNSTPISETEWNAVGLWQKIHSNPPTYVPKGYASTPPVGNSDGIWHEDPRDGKRLFAPGTTFKGYSPAVWEAEARKITGPRVAPAPGR